MGATSIDSSKDKVLMTRKQFDQDNQHLIKYLKCSPPCAMHIPGCRREPPHDPLKNSFKNLGSSSKVTNLYMMSIWTNRQTKATGRNNHLNPDTATSQYVRGRGNTRRNKAIKRNCHSMEYINVESAQQEAAEEPVVLLLVEVEWVEEAESHLAIEEEVDPHQV